MSHDAAGPLTPEGGQAVRVAIRRLPGQEDMPLPVYGTAGAAGADVHAAVDHDLVIEPGRWALVPTGLAMAVPLGWEVQVRARSGLAARHGLFVLNGPGTIDSDYRGEVKVLLANFGDDSFTVTRGLRIAQLVLARHEVASWAVVSALEDTDRGAGGFGSTGTAPEGTPSAASGQS